jgi:hypothetical protein
MWTKEKLEVLVSLYPEIDNVIISEKLQIKKGALIRKANSLGLKKSVSYISEMRKKINSKNYWSDDELTMLIELYKTNTNNELSVLLNKTKKSVGKKLKELNLYRTKTEKDFVTAKISKINGRDLTYELVESIAKKYVTRHEFYLKDKGAYSKAVKMGWLDSICVHMVSGGFSIPQLLLKDILEFILKEKCDYENRTVIKPLEIDCYFDKWKIGWEYDGRYFHNSVDDKNKRELCTKVGVELFNVHEFTHNYRDYEKNIKNQLILQIEKVNLITGLNITKEDILNYSPKIVFPNLLTPDEKLLVIDKKMTEIKQHPELFKKIKKYKLFENVELGIVDDLPKNKSFKSYSEYETYLKTCNYPNFQTLCKFEHPHRIIKRFNLPISLIHNLYK